MTGLSKQETGIMLCVIMVSQNSLQLECSLPTCPTNHKDIQKIFNIYSVKKKLLCYFPTSKMTFSFFMTNFTFCSSICGNHISHSPVEKYPTTGARFGLVYNDVVQL